jgi:hypothetical protein
MGLFSKGKGASSAGKGAPAESAQSAGLSSPEVPESYYKGILASAGYPATPGNMASLVSLIGTMFLSKAQDVIATQDKNAAGRFTESHSIENYFGGDINSRPAWGYPEWILAELGRWDKDVIPHIQGLPDRIRSIALQSVGKVPFWAGLER